MPDITSPATPVRTLNPIVLALVAVSLLGIWVTSYLTLGGLELPPRAPAWYELGLVAVALDLVMFGVSRLIVHFARKRPQWVNIPDKNIFLNLDEAARLRAMRPSYDMVLGFGVIGNLFLWGLTFDLHALATHVERPPEWILPTLFIPAFVAWFIVSIVRVRRAVLREGEAAAKAS